MNRRSRDSGRALADAVRSALRRRAALPRRPRNDPGAALDPRSVEQARAMLGCAVRGVDPTRLHGSGGR